MPEQPCAFHPDRTTLVTCSNCGRPICPEDMIDAPVGIQCPVCAGGMREGALGEMSYRVRTKVERLPVARRMSGASITTLLLGINVAVFALMAVSGSLQSIKTLHDFGALFVPLPRAEWWRMLTAMFVHFGVMHLAFNMMALYIFGTQIEARLGKLRFVGLYLVSGFFGSAASLAFTAGNGPRAGASGAVFGIIGATVAVVVRHHKIPAARAQLQSLIVLVALNLGIGLTFSGIDNVAHLGGLAAGFIIGLGLELSGRAGQRRYAALGAFGLVIVVALMLALPKMG